MWGNFAWKRNKNMWAKFSCVHLTTIWISSTESFPIRFCGCADAARLNQFFIIKTICLKFANYYCQKVVVSYIWWQWLYQNNRHGSMLIRHGSMIQICECMVFIMIISLHELRVHCLRLDLPTCAYLLFDKGSARKDWLLSKKSFIAWKY